MNFEALLKIANILRSPDLESLIIFVIIVLLVMITIYSRARLIKKAEINSINENFENALEQHKKLIQTATDVANENFSTIIKQQITLTQETTRITESLKRESISHQIYLSNYHDKSIKAIDAVYLSLLELQESTKNISFFNDTDHRNICKKCTIDFIGILDKNRIWLPPKLATTFEDHYTKTAKLTRDFIFSSDKQESIKNLASLEIDRLIDLQEKFYDYIYEGLQIEYQQLIIEIINFVAGENIKQI